MTSSNADARQVAGSHYKKGGPEFQHWNWALSNGLGYLECAATKYATRWRDKGGLVDLEKAGHYLDKLIEEAQRGVAVPVQTHTPVPGPGRIVISVEDFARHNDLGHLETEFCRRIVGWSHSGRPLELLDAKMTLSELTQLAGG